MSNIYTFGMTEVKPESCYYLQNQMISKGYTHYSIQVTDKVASDFYFECVGNELHEQPVNQFDLIIKELNNKPFIKFSFNLGKGYTSTGGYIKKAYVTSTDVYAFELNAMEVRVRFYKKVDE